MSRKQKKRQLNISYKLIEMGEALLLEGNSDKDKIISQTGLLLLFIGGLLHNKKDIDKFSELASMFSARVILDEIDYKNKMTDFPIPNSINFKGKLDDIKDKLNEEIDGIEDDYEEFDFDDNGDVDDD